MNRTVAVTIAATATAPVAPTATQRQPRAASNSSHSPNNVRQYVDTTIRGYSPSLTSSTIVVIWCPASTGPDFGYPYLSFREVN
jgi:hypothetical protein